MGKIFRGVGAWVDRADIFVLGIVQVVLMLPLIALSLSVRGAPLAPFNIVWFFLGTVTFKSGVLLAVYTLVKREEARRIDKAQGRLLLWAGIIVFALTLFVPPAIVGEVHHYGFLFTIVTRGQGGQNINPPGIFANTWLVWIVLWLLSKLFKKRPKTT